MNNIIKNNIINENINDEDKNKIRNLAKRTKISKIIFNYIAPLNLVINILKKL